LGVEDPGWQSQQCVKNCALFFLFGTRLRMVLEDNSFVNIMPKAIKTEIGAGKTILIEVVDEPQPIDVAAPGGTTAGFGKPKELIAGLDEVGDTIAVMCTTLFEKMKAGFSKGAPSEVTVEFGITLGGEAGVPFVTKGKADATFKVTSMWSISSAK